MSNVYQKLQAVRVELQKMNLKKSGVNKFSNYKYYELSDFLPVINALFLENGLFSNVSFSSEYATLKIINTEKPDEVIEFISPIAESNLKGAQPVQNLGSTQTYLRRYLYMNALEIVESDVVDSIQGKDKNVSNNQIDLASDNQKKLVLARISNRTNNKEEGNKYLKELLNKHGIKEFKTISKKDIKKLIDELPE